MPILVRPVREQLEHDRIIRLLEAKWRRRFKVEANPGDERTAGVKVPSGTLYPDLILTEEGGRKPKALVEVETNESVNHLEAMAQWANLAKSRTSLILFVPVGAAEAARRLASESSVKLAELWTYLVLGDQVRFTSVLRDAGAEPADLIEKVEVFTTERAAPAPRPIPEETTESADASGDPDRPRKLAVKAGPRPPIMDGVAKIAAAAGRVAARMANTMMTKSPVRSAPLVPRTTLSPRAAMAKAAPVAAVKPEPAKPLPSPAAIAKPAAPVKQAAPVKPAVPAKVVVAPVKPVAPIKAVAPIKPAAAPVKAAAPTKVPAPKLADKPADKPAKTVTAKPVDKVPAKPVDKPAAKKAAPTPEVKRVVAKAPPGKPAIAAKKPTVKVAARPAARKAAPAPVRPAARAVAARKAAPAAKARPSKRK